jgi:rhamnose transport system permease protein
MNLHFFENRAMRRIRGLRSSHPREGAVALVLIGLLAVLALLAPGFFAPANLRDIALINLPVMIASIGMTAIIIARQIDISTGSQFACCTVITGLLAKTGLPLPLVAVLVILIGIGLGAINGGLVAFGRIPAIVVTLATMIILRDGLKWMTDGVWVQGLPAGFQWLGLGQPTGQALILVLTLIIWSAGRWAMSNIAAGRAIHAVGSDEEAARLAGLPTRWITFMVFAIGGGMIGLAALFNSLRFAELQSNAGIGLEMKTIAAVVVGGTSINGGRGTLIGSLIGVALLGTIGTALTYLGINPAWEKAIQGAIILAAISSDLIIERSTSYAGTSANHN